MDKLVAGIFICSSFLFVLFNFFYVKKSIDDHVFHKTCLRCTECNKVIVSHSFMKHIDVVVVFRCYRWAITLHWKVLITVNRISSSYSLSKAITGDSFVFVLLLKSQY